MPRRLLFLLLGLLLLVALAGRPGAAQGPNRAGLVVQFGNGDAVGVCVSFDEQSISGYELLQRSGLSFITQGDSHYGAAVCKIGDAYRASGCDYPIDDCFCECRRAGNCNYWAYHHLQNGAWVYADYGASGSTIRNGMVDGWGYGLGTINDSGVQPPALSFEQICFPGGTPTPTITPPPTATPTRTATPLATPTPSPTATATGSVTLSPTPTLTPTPTPTGSLTATPTPSFTPTPLFTSTPSPTLRPSSTPVPTATPVPGATSPAITASLFVEPESITAGQCATLRWRVEGAAAAFLQTGDQPEQSVALASALSVCPSADTLYNLRAVQGANQQRASVYLEVLPAAATTTPAFGETPTPTAAGTSTSPTVATSATLTPLPGLADATATAVLVTLITPPAEGGQVARPVPVFTPAPARLPAANPARLFVTIGAFVLVLAAVIAAGAWALLRQRPG
ncbi:MAG: hypothetical protein K1X65_07145 [Caldilineales bacterium]|nr:hypothetical protein [Caldilineales bacterium]